jgi:hypothetical protein
MVARKADTLPLFPVDPYIAANRRVTIALTNEEPPIPVTASLDVIRLYDAMRTGRVAVAERACVERMVESFQRGHVELPGWMI